MPGKEFCSEALVWKGLRHPYIVPLIGIDTESFPSSLCMVSPWMSNGTALRYLSKISNAHRQGTIREIAQGLSFLHDQNIVHGNLPGANILIDDNGHACLTDFALEGLSDALRQKTRRNKSSFRWMAPELIHPTGSDLQNARTPATDIYSFGCVCLEVCSNRSMLYSSSTGSEHTSCTRAIHRSRKWAQS
ncbi:kinase-like domain-containing protein [Mycena vulgaris]|nr:kinase-like domain-containing protein [Mycena vulgaris]